MEATMASAGSAATSPSASAPLRSGPFRALWLGALVGLTGVWFQTVGAQWLLVSRPHASILVSLVQVATTLPYVLFGLVAGVLADTLDRRLILITVQVTVAGLGVVLAALTFADRMPPALLLLLVFLLGTGAALGTPAYQSLVPELVPRDEIPAAAALNSISINVARALGPAIAGLLVAAAGVGTTFTVAAATALCYAVVVALWHPPSTERSRPERFVPALRAGSRYVRNAPVVKRILLRAALFLVPASSLFALLPLIASRRLGLGSGGYGLLLAALGLGAIAGALVLPRVRTRLSINTLVTLASGFYALVLAAVALLHDTVPILLLLIPAGVAWVVVLSTLNASLQLFLPAWVRGRSLAVYTIVLFGSQALGALSFGALAEVFGLAQALLIAGGSAAVAAASIGIWPFLETRGMERGTVVYWPEPQLASNLNPDGRPITVTVSYRVSTANELPFIEAMERVRGSRLRTGAVSWGLYRDGEHDDTFVELFVVPSWEEHLRQHHERLTGTDRAYQQHAIALTDGEPVVAHLVNIDVPHAEK
jgi:predicted MFS family arabinose efflux permease